MSDFTKGEWKPKKIVMEEHNLYFVWAQEGELSLDTSKNKAPKVLVPCMHLPNTDPNTELVTDEKEMEANIVLMASAPKLLEALQGLIKSINPQDASRNKSVMGLNIPNYIGSRSIPDCESILTALEAIEQATTIKFK